VAIGFFHFRRENPKQVWAWATYDFANSAYATTILAVIFNKYYAGVVAGGAEGISLFGTHIPGASVFTFFVSIAMVVIALSSPILGALSDLGRMKKHMLGIHLALGLLSTAALYFIHEGNWIAGGLLFVAGQVGFAGGNVFYNALLYDIADPEDFGKVSGIGWAWGYIGGGLLLAINLVMLQFPELIGFAKDTFTVQDCFLSVAIWWGLFSIPIFRSLPRGVAPEQQPTKLNLRSAIRSLSASFHHLKDLPNFSRFFFSYLLYNDGIETVIIMASIFGDQELHLSNAELISFFLMIQGVAFFGSMIFGWLADRMGNRPTILISLFGWLFLVLWAWKLGIFGNAKTEYWFLGFIAALVMGGSQAASRSLQAVLIPPHHSAEFFSFFGISGRFASAIGPLIFGLAVFITGSLRLGILSLIIFFIAGIFLLLRVNEKDGHAQALAFGDRQLEKRTHTGH
jgi:MFS transporter, UMF1 family